MQFVGITGVMLLCVVCVCEHFQNDFIIIMLLFSINDIVAVFLFGALPVSHEAQRFLRSKTKQRNKSRGKNMGNDTEQDRRKEMCAVRRKTVYFFSCYLYFFSTLQKAINHVLDTNELIC